MTNRNSIQRYVFLLAFAFFAFILSLIPIKPCKAEEITLTTYYPSPYGVYSEMRLFPKSSPNSPCGEGTIFYDSDPIEIGLKVCDGGGNPQPIGGGGYWAAGSVLGSIYNTNPGNVGIGTNSPGQKLVVQATDIAGSAATGATIHLQSDAVATTDRGGSVLFGDTGTTRAMIKGAYEGAGSSGYLALSTKTSAGAVTEAVRIDSNGSVGIGTPIPDTRLHIAGPSTGAIRIVDGNQAAGRVMTSDANGVGTWQPPGGGGMINIRVFTAPGTFTVPAGITKLWVEVYGGGGAGGGSPGGVMTGFGQYAPGGGGGGGGGVAMGFVTVSSGQNIAVTVGAGGLSGGCGAGGNGGTSSFLTLSATGGRGGTSGSGNWNRGGDGGLGSGGSINLRGSFGEKGLAMCYSNTGLGSCTGYTSIGGVGGSNSRGISGGGAQGEPGGVFGGGGTGNYYYCCMSCNGGGTGGSGGVIIWY